jgi:exodeoxyribonuclease V
MDISEFSKQQCKAYEAVGRWLKNGTNRQQVFRLFGYAGTGKTTIARRIAEQIDGKVVYAAFTGKAAMRMAQAACADASTIHSLIYTWVGPRHSPTGFELDPDSPASDAALIVIDECSMVGQTLAEDLLSFGRPVLVIGDPGQLPPVDGPGYFMSDKPDVMLTEIHRQAENDPIIQLATLARQGKKLPIGEFGRSRVLGKDAVPPSNASIDIVLCGTNRIRRGFNMRYRCADGRTDVFPEPGEQLICLRNDSLLQIRNGEIFEVKATLGIDGETQRIGMTVQSLDFPDRAPIEVSVPTQCFTNPAAEPARDSSARQLFDYAYAVTVNKSQGSQWPHVFVYDESKLWDRNGAKQGKNWLYTAITRASESVTVAHPPKWW